MKAILLEYQKIGITFFNTWMVSWYWPILTQAREWWVEGNTVAIKAEDGTESGEMQAGPHLKSYHTLI